jgi:hypothetical protein
MTDVHRDVFLAGGDGMMEGYYQWFDDKPIIYSKWLNKNGM